MKIKIHNLTWEIDFIQPNLFPILLNNTNSDVTLEDVCGIANRTDLHIYINENLKKDLLRRTIIHELTHAYFWTYGLVNYDKLDEECVCNFVEVYSEEMLKLADKILKHFNKNKKGR